MHVAPLRIVQVSDIHLFADPERALLGVKTQESFQAILDLIKTKDSAPHFILLTGDLAQDESEAAYLRLAQKMSELQIPVYCLPGNHDDVQLMEQVYPRGMMSLQKQIIHDDWQIILLDSHIPGKVEGYLSQAELDFMEQCLKQYPQHRAVIGFHHHPLPIGCAWLDKLGIGNAEEFWELLTRFPQVSLVLFGHVHQEQEGIKQHIKYFSAPSTCIQFQDHSEKFGLAKLPPGYRVIDLLPSGEIITTVHRLAHYVGTFEVNAKGY